jgi:fucose permease
LKSFKPTIYLCCVAMMSLAIGINLPPVFLTTFGETFGGSDGLTGEQLGRIPATLFTTMVIGILLFGPLTDRYGARIFSIIGLISLSIGLLIMAASSDYFTILTAVGFLGLGVGSLEVVLSPIVAAVHSNQRARALNRLHTFYSIGAVGTVLIGAASFFLQLSWRWVCVGFALFPLLTLYGFIFAKIPKLIHEEHPATPIHKLLRTPFVLAAMLAIALGGATEVGIAQWLPAFSERELGYSKTIGGIGLAVFSIAMAIGRYGIARIVQSIGALPVMMVCCISTVILLCATYFTPIHWIAFLACISIGFTVSCLWPSTLAVAADHSPQGGATLFGLLAAAGNIGCIVMPWIIGITMEYSSLRDGILYTAICPVGLFIIFLWMYNREKESKKNSSKISFQ